MLKHLDEANNVLNAFCHTSGIGALCFDAQLNIIGCRPTKAISNDFALLCTGGVTRLLLEKLEQTPDNNRVCYTYLSEGGLACVITLIAKNDVYIGAFVTQPVFIKLNTPQETEALIEKLCPAKEDREALKTIIKRTPFRRFEKLTSFGVTLNCIAHSAFNGNPIAQIVCGESGNSNGNGDENEDENEDDLKDIELNIDDVFPIRQLRFTDYLKLKDGIQSGDMTIVEEVAEKIVNGSMPTHQLDRKNYLRSLKDSYIKVCALACFAAIEANAPYYKLLDLADEHIRQMEKLENAYEIFEMMKKTLFDFTRSVRVSRVQTHSKAVRQVLDYIDSHYDEKISLETLAEHTSLSTFYLSSLIKKETGLILTDNINTVRIEKSKNLLLDKSLNIIDIAHRVGFNYQNHFSTVFKKFTGMTPSEYVKVTSGGIESKEAQPPGTRAVEILSDQMQKSLAMLPEMYDAVRVVDPRNNTSWILKNDTGEVLSETCYAFWNRDANCQNCISRKAFLKNRSVFKIDKKGDDLFFVVAIPKKMGKETYIVEVLKKVGSDFIVEPDASSPGMPATDLSFALPVDENSGAFYDRKTLDAKLDISLRLSKLENRPFSVILSMCEDCADKDGFSATEIQQIVLSRHAQAQAVEVGLECCFVGNYTHDIMLLALGNTGYEDACRIAESIERDFENMAFSPDGQARFFDFYYGVKTLTNEIADESELVNLALMELNTKLDATH